MNSRFVIAPALAVEDVAAVKRLFEEYAHSLPLDLSYQGFDEEVASLPGDYAWPNGALLLARVAGVAMGCVGVRACPAAGGCCEIKRLYVAPGARGLGGGRSLVRAAMQAAHSLGYTEMLLDTLPDMTAARQLYETLGFRLVPAYYGPTPAGTLFMAADLNRARHDPGVPASNSGPSSI